MTCGRRRIKLAVICMPLARRRRLLQRWRTTRLLGCAQLFRPQPNPASSQDDILISGVAQPEGPQISVQRGGSDVRLLLRSSEVLDAAHLPLCNHSDQSWMLCATPTAERDFVQPLRSQESIIIELEEGVLAMPTRPWRTPDAPWGWNFEAQCQGNLEGSATLWRPVLLDGHPTRGSGNHAEVTIGP